MIKTNIILLFFLNIIQGLLAQDILIQQENSTFYTDQNSTYCVFSNRNNSSGILTKSLQDTLYLQDVIIVTEQEFTQKYAGKQHPTAINIAVKIPDLSPEGVKIINAHYLAHHKDVFYLFYPIKNVHTKSFQVVSGSYSKDKRNVYYTNEIIEGADAKTFQIIEQGYFKDKNHVYRNGKTLKGADPKTFEVLSPIYQKDKSKVWVMGKPVNIDASTFKLLQFSYPKNDHRIKSYYALDEKNVYFQGVNIANADPNTFELLVSAGPSQIYGKDKNAVYYNNQILEADASSFEVFTEKRIDFSFDAQDKDYLYLRNKKTPKLYTMYSEGSNGLVLYKTKAIYKGVEIYNSEKDELQLAKQKGSKTCPVFVKIQYNPLSLVGTYYSYESIFASDNSCGQKGNGVAVETIDLKTNKKVGLTDLFTEKSIVEALKNNPWIKLKTKSITDKVNKTKTFNGIIELLSNDFFVINPDAFAILRNMPINGKIPVNLVAKVYLNTNYNEHLQMPLLLEPKKEFADQLKNAQFTLGRFKNGLTK